MATLYSQVDCHQTLDKRDPHKQSLFLKNMPLSKWPTAVVISSITDKKMQLGNRDGKQLVKCFFVLVGHGRKNKEMKVRFF